MEFMEWVQRRLHAHDFDPGVVDGTWGRNTMNAVIAFQTAKDLSPNGLLNKVTVAALRADPAVPGVAPSSGVPKKDVPAQDLLDLMPWMAQALRKKGLHEKRNNIELRKFLKSDGPTLGDPAKLPWCGDFVETCIALTLPTAVLPTNPYLARNWGKFGATVDPCFGSILVFWRGSISGTSGHVGFYYSEDDTHFHVLGGNQSNSVNVSKLDKKRLLSAQLPTVGGPYPRKQVRKATDFKVTTNEF